MTMLGPADPGTAFKQEEVIQKLHSDVPELRELLRWAILWFDRPNSQDSVAWEQRVTAVLGEEFANSGDNKLAPKQVRKKQAQKRGQPDADNTTRTTQSDGRQPRRR